MKSMTILGLSTSLDGVGSLSATQAYKEIVRGQGSLELPSNLVVLDADSGHNDVNARSPAKINMEISRNQGIFRTETLLGTIQTLPLADNSVDAVVCVGWVINRCDVAVAIAEFERVIRPGGYLLLDFESSRSAELAGQNAFGRSAAIAERSRHRADARWVYSLTFIHNLLSALEFRIVRRTAIGALSSWALLISLSTHGSVVIRRLDSIARTLPGLTRWASGHFVVCQKSI
jgi:SAM-dependent methyltransferase